MFRKLFGLTLARGLTSVNMFSNKGTNLNRTRMVIGQVLVYMLHTHFTPEWVMGAKPRNLLL